MALEDFHVMYDVEWRVMDEAPHYDRHAEGVVQVYARCEQEARQLARKKVNYDTGIPSSLIMTGDLRVRI